MEEHRLVCLANLEDNIILFLDCYHAFTMFCSICKHRQRVIQLWPHLRLISVAYDCARLLYLCKVEIYREEIFFMRSLQLCLEFILLRGLWHLSWYHLEFNIFVNLNDEVKNCFILYRIWGWQPNLWSFFHLKTDSRIRNQYQISGSR